MASLLLVLIVVGLAIFVTWISVRSFRKRRSTAVPNVATPADLPASTSAAVSAAPASQPFSLIFLSYRHGESSDVTGRIYDHLVERFGKESLFKDVDSIPLGVDFRKQLSDSVGQCQLLLAVIGKDWQGEQPERGARLNDPRDFVRIEIESALQRGVPVIPVLVQGAPMPLGTELPPSLQAVTYQQAIAVRPDPDFHADMERLIKGIEHHLSAGATRSRGGSAAAGAG